MEKKIKKCLTETVEHDKLKKVTERGRQEILQKKIKNI